MLYWYKPAGVTTPSNTFYQLGVLVNDSGNIEVANKSVSTDGSGTFSESLKVKTDYYGSGTLLNCTDSYDFYVRIYAPNFFGSPGFVTDWVTHSVEWQNYTYSGTADCQ